MRLHLACKENSMNYKPFAIAFTCVAIVAIAILTSACSLSEAGMIISIATVGIVINGVETDAVTSIDELTSMRTSAFKRMSELRDKFNSRSDEASGNIGSFDGEERAQWDEANSHYNAIGERIETLRNSQNIEQLWNEANESQQRSGGGSPGNTPGGGARDINHPGTGQQSTEITEGVRALAFQGWLMREMDHDPSERQQQAMEMVGRACQRSRQQIRLSDTNSYRSMQQVARSTHKDLLQGVLATEFQRQSDLAQQEQRAMSAFTATSGQELVPQGFVQRVEVNQLAYSGVLQAADMLRTASGNEIPWPTMNDTGNEGVLLGENQNIGGSVDPATANIKFNAYKFSSKPILVPYELLEDEGIAPQLPAILAGMIAERLGRAKERYYTNGTGINQPQGVVTGSALGLTTAAAGAITADELRRLEHSIDPAYRQGACYMMHDSIILMVRLLKDNNGRYLWHSGLTDGSIAGRPDTINGRMVYTNQMMDDTPASGSKIALFGNFMNHKVREVNSMRFYRLTERYRDNDQDGFIAFCRGDSRTINSGTPRIKHLAVA